MDVGVRLAGRRGRQDRRRRRRQRGGPYLVQEALRREADRARRQPLRRPRAVRPGQGRLLRGRDRRQGRGGQGRRRHRLSAPSCCRSSRPVKSSSDKPRHLAWGHALVVLQGSGAAAASQFRQRADERRRATTASGSRRPGLPPTTKAGLGTSEVKNDAFTTAFTSAIGGYVAADPFWIYPKFAQIQTRSGQRCAVGSHQQGHAEGGARRGQDSDGVADVMRLDRHRAAVHCRTMWSASARSWWTRACPRWRSP